MNKNYRRVSLQDDIAVLKLIKEIEFTPDILPICLPERDYGITNKYECEISGYGCLDSETVARFLYRVKQQMFEKDECNKEMFPSTLLKYPGMICVGKSKSEQGIACTGDSGGPLHCKINNRWRLIGLASWGYRGCIKKMSVYTRVYHLLYIYRTG
ncbi:DgyrCDS14681 [Dimorphilus gyrociliatus]|uniref:DgyrCDS14680 n=1 Tax=Dimorphilus gyrociliatus TaxID=2664684 RepID=A0A7I8WEG7_9ANNE|nr:DgyrCDS14680 [Dimorphilus gyrociliatus]CAD5126591.1 DgyrCDS14681 [Dimorphilus gyrociliatus]